MGRSVILFCVIFFFASAHAQPPSVGGCQVFPADNPWNLDISAYPVHPQSDGFVAAINEQKQYLHADFGISADYGIPFIVIDSTQPSVLITYDAYGDQSDPGPFPIPANAPVEGGVNAQPGDDRHVLVIDKSNCMLYELYQGSKDATGTGWTASSGAKFDLSKSEYRTDSWTSADAAGLPIFPGLVRYEEVAAGAINHAVRFTAYRSQRGWIHPARHQAGTNDTHYPPMGLRLRLKANYDISNVTGQSKIILQALKTYGMILADNGSSWFISGTSNPGWDDNDLNQLKKIPGSAFEAVYTGPIKTAPASITITSPKIGESLKGGTANYIVHCTTANVDTLRILEFSSDAGVHWSKMIGTRGATSMTWSQVPDIASTQAMIRISDELGTVATSGVFTITSESAASISGVTVLGVTNGHILSGTQSTISWTTNGNVGSTLAAEYSANNTQWTLIDGAIASAVTSIAWTTPAPSPTMYVRVRSTDGTIGGTYGPFAIDATTDVQETKTNPFRLSNYPNPVSGKTTISFSLARSEFVSLKMYNAEGIEMATLISKEMEQGTHRISVNADLFADGIYVYRLTTSEGSLSNEMVVLK